MRRDLTRLVVLASLAGFAFAILPGCDSGGGAVTQTTQSPEEKKSISSYETEINKNKSATDTKKK